MIASWLERLGIAALWAAIRAALAEYFARQADVDAGAQQQRDAQEKADAQAAKDAAATLDEVRALDDRALRDRADRWMHAGKSDR